MDRTRRTRRLAALALAALLLAAPARLQAQDAPETRYDVVTLLPSAPGMTQVRLLATRAQGDSAYGAIRADRLEHRGDTLVLSLPAEVRLPLAPLRLTLEPVAGEALPQLAFVAHGSDQRVIVEDVAVRVHRRAANASLEIEHLGPGGRTRIERVR